MERVQNTILLHGVAYVQRSIAPDTKKTCIKREAVRKQCILQTTRKDHQKARYLLPHVC